MREVEFKQWLKDCGTTSKVITDTLSRLRRIEREIENCDIDKQYRSDKCKVLLEMFKHMGKNDLMKEYPNTTFPIGKYYMSTYRLALKKYVLFLESVTSDTE